MSTSSRRVLSNRPHEKQMTRGDDPWCLICGVNLALDGRTYTVVSQNQHSELCDVFYRVLGLSFTEDSVSVNVCNRCERQLKRLGRTSSVVVARHEGKKFCDQIEKNMSKHRQTGIELGSFQEFKSPTSAFTATRPVKDGSTPGVLTRGQSYDSTTSGSRKTREQNNRSNSGVHFDNEPDALKKVSYSRNLSAPGRPFEKRDASTSVNDTDKHKDTKNATRSSAHPTTIERQPSFRATSMDRKTSQKTPLTRERNRSMPIMTTTDTQKKNVKLTTSRINADVIRKETTKAPEENKVKTQAINRSGNNIETSQHEDKGVYFQVISQGSTNPFSADELPASPNFDSSGTFDDDILVQSTEEFENTHEQKDTSQLSNNQKAVFQPVKIPDRARFKEANGSSESSSESDDRLDKYSTQISGDRQNPFAEEDDAGNHDYVTKDKDQQESEVEESKDRVKKSKVSFSDEVFGGANDEPHQTMNPEPSQQAGTPSVEHAQTSKGKISKYESLDLDIDKTNPFFDEVFCEYRRRVIVNSATRFSEVSQEYKRGFHKQDAIPETDVADESNGSRADPESKNLQSEDVLVKLNNKLSETIPPSDGSLAYVPTMDSEETKNATKSLVNGSADNFEKGEEKQKQAFSEPREDSTPLMSDTEDNKEDTIANQDVQHSDDVTDHPSHAGQDEERAADDNLKKPAGEHEETPLEIHGEHEETPLESHVEHKETPLESQEELTKTEQVTVEDEIMVSQAVQQTQVEHSVKFYTPDEEASGTASQVKDAQVAAENDSQIQLQPELAAETSAKKSEGSPLIDKETDNSSKSKKGKVSKFKEPHQTGLPCCTIL